MPRTTRPLSAADYAILGLLREPPRHDYELAEVFRPGGDLASICGMPMNLLYAQVHRLERLSLIVGERELVGDVRSRTILAPTAEGEESFASWLDQPVERMREVRQDFLLKLYFSRRSSTHDTASLVDRQIARCDAYLTERVRERRRVEAGSFEEILTQVRLSGARATLD
jgi:PadR family transcriptional regulator AphA